jgi:hypothetical protein
MNMDVVSSAQSLISNFNAADIIWVVLAVVLGVLAFKVVLKVLKIILIVGAALFLLIFVFTSGILPF